MTQSQYMEKPGVHDHQNRCSRSPEYAPVENDQTLITILPNRPDIADDSVMNPLEEEAGSD